METMVVFLAWVFIGYFCTAGFILHCVLLYSRVKTGAWNTLPRKHTPEEEHFFKCKKERERR